MHATITAVILTYNGAKLLDRTLASLDFCDRILVVDSGSSDATLDIARAHGAEIAEHPFAGTIPQFRYAFTLVQTDWIITLDQDEYLAAEAKANVQRALAAPGANVGFFLPRLSYYFDRFIRHSGWYPDHLLRVFRLDGVEIRGTLPHEEFHPAGPTATLTGDIIHYPYADLFEHVAKINAYTRASSRELHRKGRRPGIGSALSHALGKFLKQYFLKLGILDGRAGLLLAVHACFYVFSKYARALELTIPPPDTGADRDKTP